MKITEFKNEKALDVLADLIDPLSVILTDDEIKRIYKEESSRLTLVKALLKTHKSEIIQILAILDDTPVEDYEINVFSLPVKLMELLNDPTITELFTLQGQKKAETSSGSAMENTEDGAK